MGHKNDKSSAMMQAYFMHCLAALIGKGTFWDKNIKQLK